MTLSTSPSTFMMFWLKLQQLKKSLHPFGLFQISNRDLMIYNMAGTPATPPNTLPTITPAFDDEGVEEEFVVGAPNGDGGGVTGFGGAVLGCGMPVGVGGDGGLVGADIGGTSGAEVGGTTGVGVGGTTAAGVGGATCVGGGGELDEGGGGELDEGGGGELDEGVDGGDALVVVGSYTLTANRMP